MERAANTINLSLVSHTNVGKTTLARTLLGRDIGEVGDRPHVTALAEPHSMLRDAQGTELVLWDTPGFGDSVRLAARLAGRSNPLGWFVAEVWDRWMATALWSSQQAVRNVREQADVVLYLVNAAESPEAAAYVDAEMRILQWTGRPVLVLLNQIGRPRPGEEDARDLATWRSYMDRFPFVSAVLPMDAFARCWVQEFALFREIGRALPPARQADFQRLQAAWLAQRMAVFRDAAALLGAFMGTLAADSEHFARAGVGGQVAAIARRLGWTGGTEAPPEALGMERLTERAVLAMKQLTDRLIALHGLKGEAAREILGRVEQGLQVDDEVGTDGAAVVGAVLSGALSGLAADLMAGGLTLGSGAVAGAVLGGLGFAGAARGYNLLKGRDGSQVRWNEASLERFFVDAVLLYLAVAHFGRGRGEWSRSEHPEHWRAAVLETVRAQAGSFPAASGDTPAQAMLATGFTDCAEHAISRVLQRLYPDCQLPGKG